MNPIKKLKNKRGMTLIEVLLVVALMMILLGIAMPDLISESRAIKFAGMNGNARAVAVAVQSKLYGMKNKGTAVGSEFYTLNTNAKTTQVQTSGDGTDARYFANFGKTDETGKQMLSGAITDSELLNGKIVVVYDPTTADVLEVFYGESDFLDNEDSTDEGSVFLPNRKLFPAAEESYLADNMIGSYFGDPKPELTRKNGLPPFTAVWHYDDELYLELQMVPGFTDEKNELWNKPLGIEVYAEIPNGLGSRNKEEVLIYAEGMFDSDCTFNYHRKDSDGSLMYTNEGAPVLINHTISADYSNALTLRKIANYSVTEVEGETETTKSGVLRFAFDSMVTTQMNWGNKKDYLRHQNHPEVTTMMSEVLYPRETIANWFNIQNNPYLCYWAMKNGITAENDNIYARIESGAGATSFIDVDDTFRLHIKMYVLDEDTGTIEGNQDSGQSFSATVHPIDNETYGVLDIRSPNISPYFYALSTAQNKVTLSSIRDLNNLPYVFETENKINTAALAGDIDGQLLYNKMCDVHKALMDTKAGAEDWAYVSDSDAISVNLNYFRNKEKFTLSGKKPDGGSYKIVSVGFSGRDANPGGLFAYAENCTFEYLDIVNPRVWRNGYSRSVLGEDIDHLRPDVGWGNVASGALAAVAVNCTFTNVRAYIDPDQTLRVTDKGDTPRKDYSHAPITNYRVTGNVVGGLVGVAIGGSDVKTKSGDTWGAAKNSEVKATTFTNCAASTVLGPEYLYTAEECFVAGGLVGVTVGNVQITSSYASSQLSAYYAGGLVGAVGDGTEPAEGTQQQDWEFNAYTAYGFIKGGKATGTLQISNSFAAGVIQHMVRVGGGLIAHIPENAAGSPKGVGATELPVSVSDCYSAVWWKVVPPVAYGTFEGDNSNSNYYLYPTEFDLPVTANVVARFSTTNHGNVFSLQEGDCGVACSLKTLISNLSEKDGSGAGTALKDEWVNDTKIRTTVKTWKYLESENTYAGTKNEGSYPFPMPKDNAEFWGNWIQDYDEGDTSDKILTGESASFAFGGYYATYYYNPWSMYPRNVDAGTIITNRKITLEKAGTTKGEIQLERDTIYIGDLPLDEDGATLTSNTTVDVPVYQDGEPVMVDKVDESGNKVVDGNGATVQVQKTEPKAAWIKSYYWAQKAATEEAIVIEDIKEGETPTAKLNCGQGIENGAVYGATKITVGTENTICFSSATYYSSSYNPLKGSDFLPGIDDAKVTRLMWDHYGFYLLPNFDLNSENGNTKYYIIVGDDVAQGNYSVDDVVHNEGNMSYRDITVNKGEFEGAIGYRTITLPMPKENTGTNTGTEKTVEIIWNKVNGLHVKADGENG